MSAARFGHDVDVLRSRAAVNLDSTAASTPIGVDGSVEDAMPLDHATGAWMSIDTRYKIEGARLADLAVRVCRVAISRHKQALDKDVLDEAGQALKESLRNSQVRRIS